MFIYAFLSLQFFFTFELLYIEPALMTTYGFTSEMVMEIYSMSMKDTVVQ